MFSFIVLVYQNEKGTSRSPPSDIKSYDRLKHTEKKSQQRLAELIRYWKIVGFDEKPLVRVNPYHESRTTNHQPRTTNH